MENTHEHLEHIEHAQHAAHSPFDRNVAVTMAIVAAVLACVTMLSHRAHNETLGLKSEVIAEQTLASIELSAANALQTESDIYHTKAANQWSYYQANNIRKHEYEAYLKLMGALAKDPNGEKDRVAGVTHWTGQLAKYETKLPEIQKKAEGLDEEGKKYLALAKEKQELAKKHQEEAKKKLHRSELAHHRGFWFDLSELAVEFGLVLCSLAVLTKRSPFWFTGMASGAVGVVIAAWAFFFVH